ncbi:hypothetical protein HHI36_015506 [Cryptolaemus montrouzieri]|uniref:DNA-directed RNA polymerase III subunit RPC9 n=1 Tax=Cryptolaemus montrouzieri TaxID=559131 RepID=A0ABD2N675_9CUCU
MEIVNTSCATLSNYEVMEHLQFVRDGKNKHKGQLATITYETLRYLENTPCKEQNASAIANCLKDLEPFNLNKMEKLMLINIPPTSAVEIQLMVEESEERLSEDDVEKILGILIKHFPHVEKKIKMKLTKLKMINKKKCLKEISNLF